MIKAILRAISAITGHDEDIKSIDGAVQVAVVSGGGEGPYPETWPLEVANGLTVVFGTPFVSQPTINFQNGTLTVSGLGANRLAVTPYVDKNFTIEGAAIGFEDITTRAIVSALADGTYAVRDLVSEALKFTVTPAGSGVITMTMKP